MSPPKRCIISGVDWMRCGTEGGWSLSVSVDELEIKQLTSVGLMRARDSEY